MAIAALSFIRTHCKEPLVTGKKVFHLLITGSLVKSLVDAEDHLVPHGGEDVSMGIWVSSVSAGAKYIDVPCWLPHAQCTESVLVPQLSVQQMVEMWHSRTDKV